MMKKPGFVPLLSLENHADNGNGNGNGGYEEEEQR
jgi:hypothetical protein